MADINYNDIPNIETDWQGYSGQSVQKFIKSQLNSKMGFFYYDATSNRYLVFASEEKKNEYVADPTLTNLVLGTFDAPFNYSAEINLSSPSYNAVFLGSTGNYIDFTFDIKNKQGASTGENVTITYTFIRNAVRQTVTETRKFGDIVHFNIDKYLGEGTNTVMVSIVGQTTLAATSISVTYQVVNLTIKDELDISNVYDLRQGSVIMEVPFTVSGYGTKIVEWYIDGELLDYVKNEDEVVDVTISRIKYITLSNLQQGKHSLQIRAYTTINGEKFYTDILYRDILVYTGADNKLIVGIATTIPAQYGIIGATDNVTLYGVIQYIPYALRFATYSPLNTQGTQITVKLDGETKGVVASSNGIENEFTFMATVSGNKTLQLISDDVTYTIPVDVAPTTMDIEEITADLVMKFDAIGKNNLSLDREQWTDGTYTGTLEGFNFNNTSGWVNGRLEMNAGSSFAIDLAPLAGNPTNTGKTIEIEWSTKNVSNDDAVICDLRGDNGAGLLITATKVSLISASGVVVETEYKSDENVRVSFVINRASGVSEQRLSYIYTNGIVSRSEAWSVTDNYTSNKEIRFTATTEAEVSLKSIMVYNTALTADNILNNFTLYRDTVAEMMAVYDRNAVYEEGTKVFSTEKMSGRLPIMVVTGDIPILENTSDKDTQIVVDIDYINMQNPDRSFRMTGAAMRPQGTSSMGYPKKNFRIYTTKLDGTMVYDADGNVIEDKLYAFKKGSQPVDCWCLKADYAESSGTHNTGIARLWNAALYNAQIDGEYKLRTEAQKAAIVAGYPYDVRTTIDGFPILLFYRQSENDDLIFIGKYNFNNDKSTESVFGFTGIPGFNNERMQCWEVLNNGNALALFTTTDGFDENWSEAFESRYPDTKTPNTADLKAFAEWMSNVSQEDFKAQKWEHFNIYMMAAYWIYLNRHAGADQFVKNAMFTSEDGQHFYYILYDNDTINGLINTGRLLVPPTATRQTKDASGEYYFAGHDSRLWNMLEADDEFMQIVSAVDNALYSAGISYLNTIKIFDEEQADKWVERVYNQDAQYKYIGPYVEKGINNLFMLQGKRDLHRKWWLAKRFAIYDAKYVSGTYKSQAIELKCINSTPAGQQFTVTAGYPIDYGYGINNVPRSFGIALEIGESHTFTTEEVVNLGDPIRIYGATNIAELDLSAMSSRLAVVTISNVYDEANGTKLTKLIIGNKDVTNLEVTDISGLKQAIALEYLDIQGMSKITSLDLTNHAYIKTVKAFGSGIDSVTFAKGSPVEVVELPSAVRVLQFEQLPYLTSENLKLEDNSVIVNISIKSCPKISNDFSFVYDWYTNKVAADANCSLVIDNVAWENVDNDEFLTFLGLKTNGGVLSLKGKVSLPSASIETVETIKTVFGDTVFLPTSDFFIEIPERLILEGPSRIVNGKTGIFTATPIPVAISKPTYFMVSNGAEVNTISGIATLDATTGVLSVNTNLVEDTTVIVKAKFLGRDGEYIYSNEVVVAAAIEVRPTSISINGDDSVYYKNYEHTYTLAVTPNNVNIGYNVSWSLSDSDNISIISQDNNSCVIKVLNELTNSSRKYTITATLSSVDGETVLNTSKDITLQRVVRPTSLVFNNENEEVQFVGNYTYVATPNITPINVDVTYGTPTLSGTAVTQGKVSLVSASNGTIIVKVSAETTTDLYFTIKQTATIGGDGATIEGVRQVTLKNVIRPTSMSIEGESTISGKAYEYNAILAPNTANVPMNYVWGISGSSNATIQSTNGSVCVVLADVPDEDEAFTLTCTATSTDGKTTVSATFNGTVQTRPSYVIATYNVTSTTRATQLLTSVSNFSISNVTSMEVDGVPVTPSKTYTFATTGVHTVKFETKELYYAFQSCTSLTSIDLTSFAGKPSMSLICTFQYCSALTSIEWGGCTLPNATNLTYTFQSCSGLTSIDLSPFSGAPIANLDSTFSGCNNLTSIDLSPFSGAPIKTLSNTFSGCSSLTSIDLSPLAGAPITSLGYAFSGCSSLTSIDLSPLAGAPITSLNGAFQSCTGLTSIDWGNTNFPNVQYFSRVFYNCSSLTSIDLSPFSGAPITDLSNTFQNCNRLTSIDLSPLSGAPIKTLSNTFQNCNNLTSIDLSPFSGASIASLNNTFCGCNNLTSIDLSPLNGAKIVDLNSTFQNCNNLTSIDLSPLAGAPITSLSYTFYNCSSLTSIDLSPFSGASITNLSYTFQNCNRLTSIDLSPLSGAPITDLSSAFNYCSGLTSIDLSPFSGAPITSWGYTFGSCTNMKTIIVPWINAPTVASNTFGVNTSTYTGRNTYSTGINKLIVPIGATGYDNGMWLDTLQASDKCGFTLKYAYEPQECTSLTIVADNVSGRSTKTTIYYSAITNGINILTGETLNSVEITRTATSEEFPQNTSYTDTVERTISYTYMGVTATTTIVQGVWVDVSYTIDLNDGQWELTTTVANPDSTIYDGVYQSVKSKGVNNGYDTMYIDIVGYESFQLYIRSNAESNYDYVMVSQLDQTITGSTLYSNTTLVKAHTRGIQRSGTAISDYTLVEFTGIDGSEHRITVVYRKDGSSNSGADRGYVLIPKEQ